MIIDDIDFQTTILATQLDASPVEEPTVCCAQCGSPSVSGSDYCDDHLIEMQVSVHNRSAQGGSLADMVRQSRTHVVQQQRASSDLPAGSSLADLIRRAKKSGLIKKSNAYVSTKP